MIVVVYLSSTSSTCGTQQSPTIARKQLDVNDTIPPRAVWVDLIEPTAEEDRKVQDFVVYAGNRFIASVGIPTYGTLAQTRMRPGTAPVWSHGNSGLLRVTTLGS